MATAHCVIDHRRWHVAGLLGKAVCARRTTNEVSCMKLLNLLLLPVIKLICVWQSRGCVARKPVCSEQRKLEARKTNGQRTCARDPSKKEPAQIFDTIVRS